MKTCLREYFGVEGRDKFADYTRYLTSEGERKSLINKGFIPLLTRCLLARAQVEKLNKLKGLQVNAVLLSF